MKHGSMTHDFTGRKIKKKKPTGEVFTKYSVPAFKEMEKSIKPHFRRGADIEYTSVDDSAGTGICAAPEKKEYTGTLVKGIGTMHKSNAIPIIDEQQMKDLASMRR
jgi:hypothetical protein